MGSIGGETNESGVAFFSKDLSNDDEPMQVAHAVHRVNVTLRAATPFSIGARGSQTNHVWDGLLDDVRLSSAALKQEQLLLTAEGVTEKTVGYWPFESVANYFKDTSGHGHNLKVKLAPAIAADPRTAALVDFCHVLLNANEFLYVD